MRTVRSVICTHLGVFVSTAFLMAPGMAVASASSALAPVDPPRCHGEAATIVGSTNYIIDGTPGRDVIVSNGAQSVAAGDGDDLICLTREGSQIPVLPNIRAGDGADEVYVEGDHIADYGVYVELGDGPDTYVGGTGLDFQRVLGGGKTHEGGYLPESERDSIDLVAGRGEVTVGDGGVLLDEVDVGPMGEVIVDASGLAVGASLSGGEQAAMRVLSRTEPGGSWVVDNVAKVAKRDGEQRFAWTGFNSFNWGGSSTTFRGSATDESFGSAHTVEARMGGGADRVTTRRSIDGQHQVLIGGRGHDLLSVSTTRFGGGPPSLSMNVAQGSVRFAGDESATLGFSRFEAYEAFADATVTIYGSPSADELTAGACRIRLRGLAGADALRVYENEDDLPGSCDDTHIRGGPGRDQIDGSSGDDLLYGGRGFDIVDAGRGADLCRAFERRRHCERT